MSAASTRLGWGGPPLLPSGLTASVAPGGIVSLLWQGTIEATGYVIEAGSGPGLADLAQIPTGAVTAVSGADPRARMRAVTSCGTTPPSNDAIAVVP